MDLQPIFQMSIESWVRKNQIMLVTTLIDVQDKFLLSTNQPHIYTFLLLDLFLSDCVSVFRTKLWREKTLTWQFEMHRKKQVF